MTPKYTKPMQWLHWLMAPLIIGLLALGLWMEGLPNDYPDKFTYYGWHKSFGVVALALVVIRLIVRAESALPQWPDFMKGWERKAATFGHIGLYVLILCMTVSGITMSQAGGYGVKVFGYALPELVSKDKELAQLANTLHEYFAYALIALLLAHIGAVVKHKLIDRHDVLPRMGWGK